MAIYYVKSTGGTGLGNNDTSAWSYAKYNSMVNSLLPGDTVKFLQGDTLTGALSVKSGSFNNPITYTSYNNGVSTANPIINGLSTISSWTAHSTKANVYYASVDSPSLSGILINGVLRGMGRYPNTGYLTYTSNSGNASISGTSVSTLPANFVGGEVVIKKYRYIIDRHVITNQNSSTISFTSNTDTGNGTNASYDPTPGNGYFIQGHIECLDIDGDWYYDNSLKRLYLYSVGSPNSKVVKYNSVPIVVAMNSSTDISFTGLDFVGGGVAFYCNGVSNINVTNCNFSFQTGRCSIYADHATNLTMSGGSIKHNTNTGFLIEQAASSCVVNSVQVDDIGTIPGAGWSGDHGQVGVWMNGDGITVSNCTISNIGYVGIGSFDTSNLLFEKNDVSNFCVVKDDGGGIYTYVTPPLNLTNRIIRYNKVTNAIGNAEGAQYDGNTLGEAAAIYLDGYSNNTTVTENSCATGPWAGLLINGNSNNTITYNTFYDFLFCLAVTQTATSGSGSVRNTAINNNKFIARYSSQKTMLISIYNQSDNPFNFGTFANNYYARPVSEGASITVIRQYTGTNTTTNMTVATWKSTYSVDAGSSASLVTATLDSQFRMEYNFSASTNTKSLGAVYKDVTNATYSGSITMSPWSAALLIYQSALGSGVGTKILFSTAGKILVDPSGKILFD